MIIIVLILIAVIVYKHCQARNQMAAIQSKLKEMQNSGTINIYPADALQIGKELGNGNSGKVMLAHFGETAITIAVKVLHDKRKHEWNSFVDEFVIMKQLANHPNILQLLGVVTEPGNLMICMEYCEEGSLMELLKAKRDPYMDERADIDELLK